MAPIGLLAGLLGTEIPRGRGGVERQPCPKYRRRDGGTDRRRRSCWFVAVGAAVAEVGAAVAAFVAGVAVAAAVDTPAVAAVAVDMPAVAVDMPAVAAAAGGAPGEGISRGATMPVSPGGNRANVGSGNRTFNQGNRNVNVSGNYGGGYGGGYGWGGVGGRRRSGCGRRGCSQQRGVSSLLCSAGSSILPIPGLPELRPVNRTTRRDPSSTDIAGRVASKASRMRRLDT